MSAPAGERLQKTLAKLGLASRREAEAWIRAGRLTVNGALAELGTRVLPTDQLRLDGRLIRRRPAAVPGLYVCHRSPGEALRPHPEQSAPDARPALLERLPRGGALRYVAVSPMPRQDGGLELLAADGELAARLQRSVRALLTEFSVRVHGELEEAQLERVREGTLDRGKLAVSACEPRGGEGTNRWYFLAAQGASGKEVRQLFERQGARISRILRTRLGPVVLDRRLARGRCRELEPAELAEVLAAVGAPVAAPSPPGGPGQASPRRRRAPRAASGPRSSRR